MEEDKIVFEGEIMYRRVMGKKLAFFSLKINSNEEGKEGEELELMMKDSQIIKDTKISDQVRCEGRWEKQSKLLFVSSIHILKRNDKYSIDLKKLRNFKDLKNIDEKKLCLSKNFFISSFILSFI